jgi:tRNA pseudouridine55 synthase
VDGQPLYARARQGQTIERPPRLITIYEIRLIKWSSPDLDIQVHCSSGTYIRSIAHDLGQVLGCGGFLSYLRRISIGDHLLEESIPLTNLNQENLTKNIRPMDTAVRHMPLVNFNPEQAMALFHGQSVSVQTEPQLGTLFRAYDDKSQFVGIIETDGNFWLPRKIFYQPGL